MSEAQAENTLFELFSRTNGDIVEVVEREVWAKVVMRLVQARYGAAPGWVQSRLAEASREELELFLERVITCDTLDAVFQAN